MHNEDERLSPPLCRSPCWHLRTLLLTVPLPPCSAAGITILILIEVEAEGPQAEITEPKADPTGSHRLCSSS